MFVFHELLFITICFLSSSSVNFSCLKFLLDKVLHFFIQFLFFYFFLILLSSIHLYFIIMFFFLLSSANVDDLWSTMQSALNSSDVENVHIKEIMNPWTQLKHYLVLKVTQVEDFKIRIFLENYDPSNQEMLWIPVTYYTNFYFDMILTYSRPIWLKPSHKISYIDVIGDFSIGWIIVNIDEAGKNIHNKRFIIIIFTFYKYFLFIFIYILYIYIFIFIYIYMYIYIYIIYNRLLSH